MRPRHEGRGEPPTGGSYGNGTATLQCGHGTKAVENGSRRFPLHRRTLTRLRREPAIANPRPPTTPQQPPAHPPANPNLPTRERPTPRLNRRFPSIVKDLPSPRRPDRRFTAPALADPPTTIKRITPSPAAAVQPIPPPPADKPAP